VIVQLPLPAKYGRQPVINAVDPEKDVDCITERMLGKFYTGRSPIVLPAVGAVQEVLGTMNYELGMKKVAVVGAGFLVGKPIANWLMGRVRELYILDKGSDLDLLTGADLVISGVGQAGLIRPERLKEGVGVIDFGISYVDGKMRGDFESAELKAAWYTPTPGGTGPIVVAKLFENFYTLCGLNPKP
ncbi:MAG: bifunctional 5,10-methylenetetrahydrofolate dehydrogenase/5,10-methenyltetrahydrofolate cyclohydrolase, partial [Parcubacteria group bacterium]|nr:bifunctional 5,10-methylenetetrahydrofolate dehydrogenase/5,10-methenyltetrahydrofolate cyclohydrolase [Parcubacteria group bacterium]